MLYKFLKPIVKFILHIFFRFDIEGLENIPTDKSVLLCSNHISVLDFAFIGAHIKPSISYLGKSEISKFKPLYLFLKALGFIPIRRGKSDVNAIKNVIHTIECGRSVLMFPQGTRKKEMKISDTVFKHGASLVQKKAQCDVIPISITAKKMKATLFSKITIKIGKVISSDSLVKLTDADSSQLIKKQISQLAGEML